MTIDDFNDTPVFAISVVAQLTGMHPQTLRQYDRLGLVTPQRTSGGGRRYSAIDVDRLREIQQLSADGIGLSGIKRILGLEAENAQLRRRVIDLETDLDIAHAALQQAQARPASSGAELVVRDRASVVVWRRPTRSPFPS
jgi:MerR family transcriptional regulator/heat shock protein HspR